MSTCSPNTSTNFHFVPSGRSQGRRVTPMPAEAAPTKPAPPQSEKKRGGPPKPLIILVVLAALGFGAWKLFFSKAELPGNVIALSGRIEGDDSAVSPKTTGRILEIHYREGDTVKAGDIIAVLDDEQVRAREQQAQAAVVQSQARMRSA